MSRLTQCSEEGGEKRKKTTKNQKKSRDWACSRRAFLISSPRYRAHKDAWPKELWHNPPTCNSLMAAINTFTCSWVHSYAALQHNKSINRSDCCLTSLHRCRLIRAWRSRLRMWSRRTCSSVGYTFSFISSRHKSKKARLRARMLVNKTRGISSQPNMRGILLAKTTFPNQKSPRLKRTH